MRRGEHPHGGDSSPHVRCIISIVRAGHPCHSGPAALHTRLKLFVPDPSPNWAPGPFEAQRPLSPIDLRVRMKMNQRDYKVSLTPQTSHRVLYIQRRLKPRIPDHRGIDRSLKFTFDTGDLVCDLLKIITHIFDREFEA